MKKFIFTLLVAFASSFAFTACTEEEVAPAEEVAPSNGGGAGFTGRL